MFETKVFDDGTLNRVTAKALGVIMPKLGLIDFKKEPRVNGVLFIYQKNAGRMATSFFGTGGGRVAPPA